MAESQDIAVALVGTLVRDELRFHGPAFNRAGQMFQDELAAGLVAAGLDLTVYSVEPVPAWPRSRRLFVRSGSVQSRSGLLVHLLPFVNAQPAKAVTAGLSLIPSLLVWAWRHRHRPRVILCINLTMPPGIFPLFVARVTRSKAVASVLDVWKPGGLVPDTWQWRLDFRLQRRLIPRFDGLMVVSEAIAEDFAPGRKVCRVEGGVAPDRFTRAPRTRAPRPDGQPFRVVLAGTLERFNGVEVTLEAFARLPGGYELVVAGKGSLEGIIREHAARDRRIVMRGFLAFEDVLDLYWTADLVLNMRLTDAVDTRYFFPSKLMELLASGTPVLSTCTGPVATEYGQVAYLLQEETPGALAERIQAIAAIPFDERRAFGERARTFMLAEKTWRRQAGRLADYLRREVVNCA